LSRLSSRQIGTGDPLRMPKKFITLLFLGCLLAHAQSIRVQKPSLLWLSTHVAQAQAQCHLVFMRQFGMTEVAPNVAVEERSL
jgi:hypothetical protein